MYKIKRFSSLTKKDDTYKEKPSKAIYTAGAAYGANKYNKWARDITEKQIPELAKRASQGSEYAADVLNRLNHPKTRVSFQDIARKSVEKGSKIGGKLGAGIGATLGIGSMAIGYKIHKNKYNKFNKGK